MANNSYSGFFITILLYVTAALSWDLSANPLPDSGLSGNTSNIGVMTRLTVADGMSSDIIRSIYRDSQNLLWIGTSSGLNRWDGHEIRVYSGDQPGLQLHSGFVSTIQEDAKGNIWLEWDSQNLVYLREYDCFIPVAEYIDGLKPNTHYNILIDDESNIWTFDYDGELTLFDPSGRQKGKVNLSRDFGDRLDWISHPDGGILILYGQDGVVRIDNNMEKSLFLSSISGRKQFAEHNKIFFDIDGKLWVYSYHDTELHCYDPSTDE